ncbi:protein distal antenna-related [Zeugodacus cucurbitae]|uniref:protein distal antenna-related n=1 Tax=Zeugodacus cucurbitae TaxID=28588 RepID=UPI0023D8F8DF|nr:protein distal antenna-related [Zeugodacus cucurbitae]XP_011195175.2 protein distal antenna-related [Zeugodacus cucurbitae]
MDLSAYQKLNIHMSTRGKRPLRNLTPNDKVRAIQRIHQGETKASVSRDIGVPESTLRGWCKNENKLRFMCRQMNETNEFEQFPISKLENFQPAVKRNKLDGTNLFTSTINIENLIEYNRISNINNCAFDINNNSNYENSLLEETLCEFLKNKSLPDSTGIMRKNLKVDDKQISTRFCTSGKTLSSINPIKKYKDFNFSPHNSVVSSEDSKPKCIHSKQALTGPNSEGNDTITYNKWSKCFSEFTNNETIKTSNCSTDGNLLGINNRNDVNFNQRSVNNKNNECSNESRLLSWCKIFDASFNFLALAATTATLPSSDDDARNNKLSQKHLEYCISETKTPTIQREFLNYSYYGSEPEDLSIHSTVSKTSSSTNSKNQVTAESITSSVSLQSDADS